ncbi:MAG TPA: hypothetical protein DCY56_04615 [Candidatus Omnitrophica bacterium]|nr:hypothetical protein [Candidatus Omnitrophota bacterium]
MKLGDKKHVLFRADGSNKLGTGHIMRCLTFAHWLKKNGVPSVLVTKDYDRNIVDLSRSFNCKVEMISGAYSFKEDANITNALADRYRADVIISDMNNADTLTRVKEYIEYLEILKNDNKFSIVIDGFGSECISAKTRIPSDITVIPYFGSEDGIYMGRDKTQYLLGSKYFIFREEFIKVTKIKRKIKKNANNVLVTMGGSDPFRITIKVVKALGCMNKPFLNLKVILGAAFNSLAKKEIKAILEKFRGDYKIIENCNNMAELMLWSDLVIINGGLTKYEAAITGTPTFVVSHSEAEKKIMKDFQKGGSAIHLGYAKNIKENIICEAVEDLLSNNTLRKRMSEKGRGIVDGKGADRIISRIPKELLK